MTFIDPTPEQAGAFAASTSEDEPVFMLNLLRFKDRADGIDADDGITGAEAYGRYAEAVAPFLAGVGGEIVWSGACGEGLIGPVDERWDMLALVRYPSRAKFLEMVTDEGYQAIGGHRSAALADSRLVPCRPVGVEELV